jgi:hypothetical protein
MEHNSRNSDPSDEVRQLPVSGQHAEKALILAGQSALGSVDSPSSTDKYALVLRENSRGLQLIQSLVVVEVEALAPDGSIVRQLQLGQIRDIQLRNQHHEIPLFQAQLRRKGHVPGLSGRADHVTASVRPVDAIQLDDQGRVIGKTSAASAIPPTGSDVRIADNQTVARFIPADTPGLMRFGYLVASTHLPLRLPHFGHGDDGSNEALHIGIFGNIDMPRAGRALPAPGEEAAVPGVVVQPPRERAMPLIARVPVAVGPGQAREHVVAGDTQVVHLHGLAAEHSNANALISWRSRQGDLPDRLPSRTASI